MKYLIIFLLILIPVVSLASSGVIVEKTGDVTITLPSKETKDANAGMEFPEGSIIKTKTNSSAVIVFSNGTIKKLSCNKTYKATGTPDKKNSTFVAGLREATRESIRRDQDPTAHMTVKKVAPTTSQPPKVTASPEEKSIIEDIAKITMMKLSPEATSFMRAKVYYNYGRYSECVKELKPFCSDSSCPNKAMTNLFTKAINM